LVSAQRPTIRTSRGGEPSSRGSTADAGLTTTLAQLHGASRPTRSFRLLTPLLLTTGCTFSYPTYPGSGPLQNSRALRHPELATSTSPGLNFLVWDMGLLTLPHCLHQLRRAGLCRPQSLSHSLPPPSAAVPRPQVPRRYPEPMQAAKPPPGPLASLARRQVL